MYIKHATLFYGLKEKKIIAIRTYLMEFSPAKNPSFKSPVLTNSLLAPGENFYDKSFRPASVATKLRHNDI